MQVWQRKLMPKVLRKKRETSIRISPAAIGKLQALADRLHVPVALIIRGGVDSVLAELRNAEFLPTDYLEEQSKSTQQPRTVLLNVYLSRSQSEELRRQARRLQAKPAGLIRTAMSKAYEELRNAARLPDAYFDERDREATLEGEVVARIRSLGPLAASGAEDEEGEATPSSAAAAVLDELTAHAQRLDVPPAAIIRAGVARVVEQLRELGRLPVGFRGDFV